MNLKIEGNDNYNTIGLLSRLPAFHVGLWCYFLSSYYTGEGIRVDSLERFEGAYATVLQDSI